MTKHNSVQILLFADKNQRRVLIHLTTEMFITSLVALYGVKFINVTVIQ